MKFLIASITLLLFFTSAFASAPGQTVGQYVEAVNDRAFRGCDRNASVLEGTDNTGSPAGTSSGGTSTGSGGGQR